MLNPVQLYYIDRPEQPGFEAVCDVFSGFGATAAEALSALAGAIEAGPVKYDPNFLSVVTPHLGLLAPSAGIDYDKLAEALVRAQAKAVDAEEQLAAETPAATPPAAASPSAPPAAPAPAPAPAPASPPPAAPTAPVQVGPVDLVPQEPAPATAAATEPAATSGAQPGPVPGV